MLQTLPFKAESEFSEHFQDCEEDVEPEKVWVSVLLTCGAARCIEGEHSLNGDVHGRDVEGFEHDLEGQQEESAVCKASQHLLTYRIACNHLRPRAQWSFFITLPIPMGPALTAHTYSRSVKTLCRRWYLMGKECLAELLSCAQWSYLGHLLPVGLRV